MQSDKTMKPSEQVAQMERDIALLRTEFNGIRDDIERRFGSRSWCGIGGGDDKVPIRCLVACAMDRLAFKHESTTKCLVKGCHNRRDQGTFVGDLCAPCHEAIVGGHVRSPGCGFIGDMQRDLQKCVKGLEAAGGVADSVRTDRAFRAIGQDVLP
jgi:hypothetical protein